MYNDRFAKARRFFCAKNSGNIFGKIVVELLPLTSTIK